MSEAPAKTALITGASRGIGRAVAERLARDGFAVVVNFAGNAAKAEETVAKIAADGGRAVAVQADIAKRLTSIACLMRPSARSGRSAWW